MILIVERRDEIVHKIKIVSSFFYQLQIDAGAFVSIISMAAYFVSQQEN